MTILIACLAVLSTKWRHTENLALPFLNDLSAERTIAVEVEGVISDEPKVVNYARGVSTNCELRLDWISQNGQRREGKGRRIRVSLWDTKGLNYGDKLSVSGALGLPEGPRNPGEFDYPAWLALNGVHAELTCRLRENVTVLGQGGGNPVKAAALHARDWIEAAITQDLREDDQETAGVIAAMVLGEREEAPDEILRDFRYSGTLHIFAVSGLHVGMIALILMEIFKLMRVRLRVAAVLIIATLIFYAFVTGLRPSAVRATVMATVLLFGQVIDRPARLPNSLGAAALLILAFDPFQAMMPGFQLSFAVLAAIAMLCQRFDRRLTVLVSPDPFMPKALIPAGRMRMHEAAQWLAAYLSLSISAWAGSTILIAVYFNLLTPIAIFANVVIVPIAFAVIFAAVVSTLFQIARLPGISVLVNNANFGIIKLISVLIAMAAAIPGGHFFVTKPGFFRSDCEIGIFDFPRGGGGAHIHTSTAGRWQIDAGSSRSYERILEPFLQKKGMNRLDGLILTHADSNHTGAAPLLERDYKPQVIAANVRDKRSPSLSQLNVDHALVAGDVFEIDHRTTLTVLFPPAGYESALADGRCAVIRLDCDGWRVLFTGDAGFTTERWLMEHCAAEDLRADVLVRGANRESVPGDLGFVKMVAPKVMVATNAEHPEGERLPETWKSEVESAGIALFDQAESGHVSVWIDEGKLRLRGFVSGKEFEAARD